MRSVTELEKLNESSELVAVAKDEVIFNKGDEGDFFYIVASGEVSLFDPEQTGHEALEKAKAELAAEKAKMAKRTK